MSKLQQALQGVQGPNISTRELQQQQFKGTTVQARNVTQTDYSGQLMGVAQAGAQIYAQYDKEREAQGIKRKNEIMLQNLKPEEMRKLRESGELLYQDDSYAMRALDKALGRQEAFAVEGVIQERIAQGYYKDRKEMEEERARMLESSMNTMAESYGIAETNRAWFNEGYASDMTDRSFAIYGAMDKKVDEYNRNSATLSVDNEMTELVKSGNGQHIVDVLNTRLKEGVIRSEAAYEAHLTKALKEVSAQPQSVDALNALADTEYTMHGETTTLRKRLGDETIKSMSIRAAETSLANNWKQQEFVLEKLQFLTAPDFDADGVNAGIDAFNELEEFAKLTQGEASTQVRRQIFEAKTRFDALHKAWNEKKVKEVNTKQQQMVRLAVLDAAVNGRETGDLTRSLKLTSFTEDDRTGKFEAQDWNRYFDFKSDQIDSSDMSPDQKAIKKLQLGVLLKDIPDSGFGAHYAEQFTRVSGELAKYSAALDAGAELPATPEMDKMMEFYKASPELFSQTFGPDFPMASSIAISANMGVHPSVMIQGQKRLETMRKDSPDQYGAMMLELKNLESNQGADIYQTFNTEQREAVAALYAGLEGYSNSEKIRAIREQFEKQYTPVEGVSGSIPKSFLLSDPQDPSSVSVGKQRLEAKIAERFPNGNTTMRMVGDRLVIYNAFSNEPMVFTKEMLLAD
ncbi:internal virion protein [Aeromonas phage phiA014S]|uniref:Internal virion protein n=1 Tax=Aeromonas phage phiA014S TaxID=3119845 RepID=A0ABZ2CSU6_9CAUD